MGCKRNPLIHRVPLSGEPEFFSIKQEKGSFIQAAFCSVINRVSRRLCDITRSTCSCRRELDGGAVTPHLPTSPSARGLRRIPEELRYLTAAAAAPFNENWRLIQDQTSVGLFSPHQQMRNSCDGSRNKGRRASAGHALLHI